MRCAFCLILAIEMLSGCDTPSLNAPQAPDTLETKIGKSFPAALKGRLLLAGFNADSKAANLPKQFRAGVVSFGNGRGRAANFDVSPSKPLNYGFVCNPTLENGRLLLRYVNRPGEEGYGCTIFESNLFDLKTPSVVSAKPLVDWGIVGNPAQFTSNGAFIYFACLPWSSGQPRLVIRSQDRTILSEDISSESFAVSKQGNIYFSQGDPALSWEWYPRIWVRDKSQKILNTRLKGVVRSLSPDGKFLAYSAPLDARYEMANRSIPEAKGLFLRDLTTHQSRLLAGTDDSTGSIWMKREKPQLLTVQSQFSLNKGRQNLIIRLYDVPKKKWLRRVVFSRSVMAKDARWYRPEFSIIAVANDRFLILEMDDWKQPEAHLTFVAIDLKTGRQYDLFSIQSERITSYPDAVWVDG